MRIEVQNRPQAFAKIIAKTITASCLKNLTSSSSHNNQLSIVQNISQCESVSDKAKKNSNTNIRINGLRNGRLDASSRLTPNYLAPTGFFSHCKLQSQGNPSSEIGSFLFNQELVNNGWTLKQEICREVKCQIVCMVQFSQFYLLK